MSNRPEIDGYTRRKDFEERRMTLSSIALLVCMLPGLALLGLVCFREWASEFLFLGVLLIVAPYGVMKGFYAFYRFKCPQCRCRMKASLADESQERFPDWTHGFSVNGRLYTHPHEESHGWVRIVDRILRCDHCKTYCVVYPKMERALSPQDKLLIKTVEHNIPKDGYVDFGEVPLHGADQAAVRATT